MNNKQADTLASDLPPALTPSTADEGRRHFMLTATAAAAASSGWLTACGGGGAEAAPQGAGVVSPTQPTVPPAVPVPPQPPAPVAPPPTAPASAVLSGAAALPGASGGAATGGMRVLVSSATGGTLLPFTLGFAFRKGDVPAGSTITFDHGLLQATPKNRWNDGSLKFAVLAGRATLSAGTEAALALRAVPGPAAPASVLGLAELRAASPTARFTAGALGEASWSADDWYSPVLQWVSGPEMSSWLYRKPFSSAGVNDAHLVAWMEVRLYIGGVVEVLPWVENGYLRVPGPTNKNATYTFTLGGTQRFSGAIDLKHHQRTPLVSGAVLSHWLGAVVDTQAKPDRIYLQKTELVPTYRATVAATASAVAGLAASFTPLQAGNFNYDGDSMASGGYQDPIGLLPQHDVLYLTSDAPTAYAAVIRNGYSAGRYGIHYRDETTQRPLRFSQHATLVLANGSGFKDNGSSTTNTRTPAPTGGNPPTWDVAHSPSVGFLAYLLTGRWYFMEEVQFATTCNYVGNGDNTLLRTGSKGLVKAQVGAWQTRSCAWDWRARVQALAITPDEDAALRGELTASVEANVDYFHQTYIATPNNPWGWITPGETYTSAGLRDGAPWQQDFVTAAFGYSIALELPISPTAAAKLNAFFQWKAISAVSRLGDRSGFWYVNAVPYTARISPTTPNYANGAGPWYATPAEVYAATYATPPSWLGAQEGVLAAEFMPGERALWGNLQPAIAYAVRFGVQGAAEGYLRMTGATNWPALRDAFNSRPVWAVAPPAENEPVRMPTWLRGKPLNTWFEIPNTAGAGGAAVDAYSGMGLHEDTGEIIIAAAGGHNDSFDNRVVSLNLMFDAPAWVLRSAPSTNVALDVPYYSDGKPTSRHLYQNIHVVESLNRVFLFGCRAGFGNAFNYTNVDAFDLTSNKWDPAGTWPAMPGLGDYGIVRIRSTGEVYSNALRRWSPQTNRWVNAVTQYSGDGVRWPMAHDTKRNQLFSLQWGDGQGFNPQRLQASRVDLNGTVQSTVTFNPSPALTQFQIDKPAYAAMDYDPDNDRFLFYWGLGSAAGQIYQINPNATGAWDMSFVPLAAGSPNPPSTPPGGAGVNSRFRYVPSLKGFVLLPQRTTNLWFIRTA